MTAVDKSPSLKPSSVSLLAIPALPSAPQPVAEQSLIETHRPPVGLIASPASPNAPDELLKAPKPSGKEVGSPLQVAPPSLGAVNRAAEKKFIDAMLADPIGSYERMRTRLETVGMNASFPEFRPVVTHLMMEMKSPDVESLVGNNLALRKLREIALSHLAMVGLEFAVAHPTYPYPVPYNGELPYRPTLEAVMRCLEFFDCVAAVDPKQDPAPLYHVDRYLYYWGMLANNTRVILVPTISELGFTHFIKTRAVPLAFMGVVTQSQFADRHVQSPLDFAVHDVNHGRRILAYIEGGLRDVGVLGKFEEEVAVMRGWDGFIKEKLLPLTDIAGKTGDARLLARMNRLIVFELLHESAINPTREAMLKAMLRKPGEPEPFEHMVPGADAVAAFDAQTIENLRVATGNLDSGLRGLGYPGEDVTIRYFMDRAVVLLGNVYNKMTQGFYDKWWDPQNYVAPVPQRTATNLARGAMQLYQALDHKTDLESAKAQVLSQQGSEEFFEFYPKAVGLPENALE